MSIAAPSTITLADTGHDRATEFRQILWYLRHDPETYGFILTSARLAIFAAAIKDGDVCAKCNEYRLVNSYTEAGGPRCGRCS